ncbi:twin-arginine translocase TatA/TatE family subunit [Candidatus Poribacteria bacterium]|nr:twin-arginine translocase TatA/TatE family subunit [Candidatus Poribacteria bacterium]
MPGIGSMELFILVLLALIVFGPQKLPEIGKTIGKTIKDFKSAGNEIKQEITKVTEEIDINSEKTIKPLNQSNPNEIKKENTEITEEIETEPDKSNNTQNQTNP